jgi:hypothetical protein
MGWSGRGCPVGVVARFPPWGALRGGLHDPQTEIQRLHEEIKTLATERYVHGIR